MTDTIDNTYVRKHLGDRLPQATVELLVNFLNEMPHEIRVATFRALRLALEDAGIEDHTANDVAEALVPYLAMLTFVAHENGYFMGSLTNHDRDSASPQPRDIVLEA